MDIDFRLFLFQISELGHITSAYAHKRISENFLAPAFVTGVGNLGELNTDSAG